MRIELENDDVKQACIEYVQRLHPDKVVTPAAYLYVSPVTLEIHEAGWTPPLKAEAVPAEAIQAAPDVTEDIPL